MRNSSSKVLIVGIVLLLILPFRTFPNTSLSRTILVDDFGGYQFSDEITEILRKARLINLSFVEFKIVENRHTNNPKSKHGIVYSPSSGGDSPAFTKFRCYIVKP